MTPLQTPVSQDMPRLPGPRCSTRVTEAGSLLGDEVQWIRMPDIGPPFASLQNRRPAGVREFLRNLENRRQAIDELQVARLAMVWISENEERYAGRWVALRGNVLLAEGDSAGSVYAQVANLDDPPFVVKVEVNDRPFAGW
jgi:hypothetical protein